MRKVKVINIIKFVVMMVTQGCKSSTFRRNSSFWRPSTGLKWIFHFFLFFVFCLLNSASFFFFFFSPFLF